MTNKKIKSFNPGDKITAFFVIRKTELKTKRDGEPYLVLNLGDSTGRITATVWNEAQIWYNRFKEGNIVKIQGSVRTYNENLQLTIDKIRKAEPGDQIEPAGFIPRGNFNVESLYLQLLAKLETVADPHLKNLLGKVFNDPEIAYKFKLAPGGKLWHHAYSGGLLEHTLSVLGICETMAERYPAIKRDLLISGALLHDIGKLQEYNFDKGFIDFTDQGRLQGHITIGARFIENIIDDLAKETEFPVELKNLIIHLILSHQGELAHGSPVLPACPEAFVLYYADEMDSKTNAVFRIIERDSEPGKNWSQYINLLDRFIYLGTNDSETIL